MNYAHTTLISTLTLGLSAAIVNADVVDLRDLPGNFDQQTWGHNDTTLYAQSLLATGSLFEEFRFRATSDSPEGIDYTLVVTGARVDPNASGLGWAPDLTDIRYESALSNIAGTGSVQEAAFGLDLDVTEGELLFVILNTYTVGITGSGTVRATEFNGEDQYAPGEFVFLNTSGPGEDLSELAGQSWSHRASAGEDLAIYASFVPAPGSLALFGLGSIAFTRRSRK